MALRGSFGAQLKALREAAGFTQEELATIAGLSVHAVSALERGERRRPHVETVRALSAALDLTGAARDALLASARAPAHVAAVDELSGVSLPLPLQPCSAAMPTCRPCGTGWPIPRAADHAHRAGRRRQDPPGAGGRTRDRGRGRIAWCSSPLAAIRKPRSWRRPSPKRSGCRTSRRWTCRRARARMRRVSPTLLVLDNFEQVLDAAPLVADLLTSVATLRVLATSRAPLRVRGEREYAVGPLALDADADAMPPADLAHVPAVRLFVERVRDVQPEFRLTAANGATVTAICRRLDALPLALELAAPWLKALTAEDLFRRLEHDVLLSTVGPRDLPERQQTINATVAWSYRLLAPDEQRVFRRLGALPGRFPIEAATAVLAGREGPSVAIEDALPRRPA